jgi:predicted RNA binding protein YcfA (HicA-like mRNA interferase family)
MASRDPIIEIAARFGFMEHRRKRHRIWKHPSGIVVTTGSTLSDRRALLNIEKQFRRALMRGR